MAEAADAVIRTAGLSKVFRDFWGRPAVVALDGVDIEVPAGEVFALLGPNGSGKTTLIKILLGLLHPSSGSVRVLGCDAFDVAAKARIGFMPESAAFYPHMSGLETLHFHGRLLGLPAALRRGRIEELLHMTHMEDHAHRPMGEYSLGMTKRIGIAQSLLADPELLVLDEPTGGLDPLGIEEIHQFISALQRRGKTVFISTHLLAESGSLCSRLAILHMGRVLCQGRQEELLAQHGATSMKDLFLSVVGARPRGT